MEGKSSYDGYKTPDSFDISRSLHLPPQNIHYFVSTYDPRSTAYVHLLRCKSTEVKYLTAYGLPVFRCDSSYGLRQIDANFVFQKQQFLRIIVQGYARRLFKYFCNRGLHHSAVRPAQIIFLAYHWTIIFTTSLRTRWSAVVHFG